MEGSQKRILSSIPIVLHFRLVFSIATLPRGNIETSHRTITKGLKSQIVLHQIICHFHVYSRRSSAAQAARIAADWCA